MPANPTRYTMRIRNTVTQYMTQAFPCGANLADAERLAAKTARDSYSQCVVEVSDSEAGERVVHTVAGKIPPSTSRIAAEARIMAKLIKAGHAHEPPPDWKPHVDSELAKLGSK